MNYLTNGIQERLQKTFFESNISLDVRLDHVVAENSSNQTENKIIEIIKTSGFCPLISENKINGNFVFTIVPYRIPAFFNAFNSSIINPELVSNQKISINQFELVCEKFKENIENRNEYFNLNELSELLKEKIFIKESQEDSVKDVWSEINMFRPFVSSSLTKGLLDVLSPFVKNECPLVEIGSGIGYSLPESLSSITIRVQPGNSECRLLSKTVSEPIYQMDIEGLHSCLSKSNKKIPLFFALNVFDTMSTDDRKVSFSRISQLQSKGDKIVILLDTNPYLEMSAKLLESQYPGHVAMPFFPLTQECSKFSFILVPVKFIPEKPTTNELVEIIETSSRALMQGGATELQRNLHQMQKKLGLKVVAVEDFFATQITNDLKESGYTSNAYYHTSFTWGNPSNSMSGVKQDLIYKSVTDTCTMRQWSLSDENLIKWLNKKNLSLPVYFNENFLFELRKNKQKIFGAEFLIIEATKKDDLN